MLRRRTLCLLLCAVALCGFGLAGEPTVEDVLAKTPAKTIAEGQALAAALAKMGPAAVQAVCKRLVEPGKGDDVKARFALHGLALYCARPDAEAQRKPVAAALVAAMAAESRPEVKKFLIRQLQLVGKDEAVPALAPLLAGDAFCEPATQALTRIRTPNAVAALATALPAATGARLVTLIRALGRLRVKAAAAAILPHAASKDATTRRVALFALANIGEPSAESVLAGAAKAEGRFERSKATSCYLLFARRLAEAGRKTDCARICRGLIKTRTKPRERHVVSAALHTLVTSVGAAALPDLMAATEHPDKQIRLAALRLAESLPGEAVTAQWVKRLKQAPPPVRVEILGTLGRRGDRTALPAVLGALKDTEQAVRLAAIPAAAALGGRDVLAPLLAALNTDQAGEVKAVQRAITTMKGKEVAAAVAAAVPKAPAAARAALLDVLAARKATPHVDTVLEATADKDANVRLAAVRALAVVAGPEAMPRLVALLLGAESSREQATALRVLVTVAAKIEEPEARAAAVLASLGTAKGDQRAVLLKALARLGGTKALAAVVADATSADAARRTEAIRTLADWPDASAAPALLDAARTAKELNQQVLALRGYVRVVRDAAALPATRKIEMLGQAMGVARRPAEKSLVLSGFGSVRTLGSLKAVARYLDDKELADAAAVAAVRIACPAAGEPGLRGEALDILKKVVAATKNPRVRKEAQSYLDSIPPADAHNVAQGKPATANVGHEGANGPDKAVDGKAHDTGSGWWGRPSRGPRWFQVDLGEPTRIDSVHVFWYWGDGRHYRYTVEVSADAKAWSQVADMRRTRKPCTAAGSFHKFQPVAARYVRLNNIVNSSNTSCHLVELRVYAEGKAPKPD